MSVLESLNALAADKVQDRAVRDFHRGNLDLWRSRMARFGVDSPTNGSPDADEMQTVRIDSPDTHYHYTQQRPPLIPGWVKAAAVVLGGAAGGATLWNYLPGLLAKKTPPVSSDPEPALNPGGLGIEVIKAAR